MSTNKRTSGMTNFQLFILGFILYIIIVVFAGPITRILNLSPTPTPRPTATPDLRPRISNCLPWHLLSPEDVGKTICVAGIVQETMRVRYGASGKAFYVGFFEEDNPIRFRLYVYMKSHPGTPTPFPGDWDAFRELYPFDVHKNCVGVSGTVVDYLMNEGFYAYDPSYETYFMEVNYPEFAKELEGCEK